MAQFTFTDMEQAKMTNALIQIDDEIREMTDEEYAAYEAEMAKVPPYPLEMS